MFCLNHSLSLVLEPWFLVRHVLHRIKTMSYSFYCTMVKWLLWRVEYLRSFLKLAEWSCHVLGSDALAGAAATILYWGVTLRRKDNWGNDRVGSKKQVGAPCLWGACVTNTGPWENALAQKLQLLIWTRRTLMLHESLVSAFISCPSLGWRSPWVPERAKVARLYPGVKIVTLWEPYWCPQRWQYRIG